MSKSKSITLFGFTIQAAADLGYIGLGVSFSRGSWPTLYIDLGPISVEIYREESVEV